MLKALIVEDDLDQAEMLALMLASRDYQVEFVDTGQEALRLARSIAPQLIFLDLMLPDMTGFDVCRDLRSDRATMLIPIIMITALGDDTHRTKGFRVGANVYVTKPYGPADIDQAIGRVDAWRDRLTQGAIDGEIHVEFNSELSFLQEVNDFLLNLKLARPWTNDQLFGLQQALMEMGQNAIEWGNQHRSEALVNIIYRIHHDHVEIVIRDQGTGFDPNDLAHAASEDDPIAHMDVREKLGLREGGFGLMISRGLVDELRHNELGNEVTLIKRFSTAGMDRR